MGSKITRAAQGLAALGFRAGDRLAILAETRRAQIEALYPPSSDRTHETRRE